MASQLTPLPAANSRATCSASATRLLNSLRTEFGTSARRAAPVRLIEHGFDAEAPRASGNIGLIDGAQFLDAAGQQIEIDGADAPAFGEHAVEHGDMRVQLRIRRLQRHFANVGVSPALRVAPFDTDRRPGGVVLKADPPSAPGSTPSAPPCPLRAKPSLCLGIGHRVGHSALMDVKERAAFGSVPGRQGPRDRERLVGRKRQIDKSHQRPRRMDLPAIIRHINETASSERPIRQMREFCGAGFAMRRYVKRRLEALARALDDVGRQGFAGSALRCAAVGALAAASTLRIASTVGGSLGSRPNTSATLRVALCFLRASMALPSRRRAFNRLAIWSWVNGRAGAAMPRRAASAGRYRAVAGRRWRPRRFSGSRRSR